MIDVALTVLALFAGGLTLEVYATARAPRGYQDEYGFQLSPEAEIYREGCPSNQPD